MTKISKIITKLSALLIISLLAACSNSKGWVYRANSYAESHSTQLQNKTIAILPFSDKRSNENQNNILIYMIPLAPFGYQNLSSPESVPMHANSSLWLNFNPKEDFAKALVEELNSSRIFREASFATSSRDSEYYINGEIFSTEYNSKLFSYGLSVYGPLLWYFGFPATHVTNDLQVKLSVFDTKTRKQIFTKTYAADHYGKTGWIYSLPSDFRYSEMLASVYKNFLEDLKKENLADKK